MDTLIKTSLYRFSIELFISVVLLHGLPIAAQVIGSLIISAILEYGYRIWMTNQLSQSISGKSLETIIGNVENFKKEK